jgi:hypothetical protein
MCLMLRRFINDIGLAVANGKNQRYEATSGVFPIDKSPFEIASKYLKFLIYYGKV